MANYEAPCGVHSGQIVEPAALQEPQWGCEAIMLIPATGIRYSNQITLPPDQRTQEVYDVMKGRCEAICDRHECPVYDLKAPAESTDSSE